MNQNSAECRQDNLVEITDYPKDRNFISVYRVSLIKDHSVSFNSTSLTNSSQAYPIIKTLIETRGQPDREQFCVLLLDAKNQIIGLNIVSMGSLTATTLHPREILKPAILSNAAAMILCHNHPSNEVEPSPSDIEITRKIVQAAVIMGIHVHEHMIISMYNEKFYSMSDHGIIQDCLDSVRRQGWI